MPAVNAYQVMVRRYLQPRIAELPADREGYLRGLLDLHHDLVKRGHLSPEAALATVLGVPQDTVRDSLEEARQR